MSRIETYVGDPIVAGNVSASQLVASLAEMIHAMTGPCPGCTVIPFGSGPDAAELTGDLDAFVGMMKRYDAPDGAETTARVEWASSSRPIGIIRIIDISPLIH